MVFQSPRISQTRVKTGCRERRRRLLKGGMNTNKGLQTHIHVWRKNWIGRRWAQVTTATLLTVRSHRRTFCFHVLANPIQRLPFAHLGHDRRRLLLECPETLALARLIATQYDRRFGEVPVSHRFTPRGGSHPSSKTSNPAMTAIRLRVESVTMSKIFKVKS